MLVGEGTHWTFPELIRARAAATPNRVMFTDDRERSITYGEYRDACTAMAQRLLEQGVARGDRVVWQLPTRIETAVLMGGLSQLGAVQIPLMPQYRARELKTVFRQVRPSLILVAAGADTSEIEEAHREIGIEAEVIALEELPEASGASGEVSDAPSHSPDSPSWVIYTSGTTAEPKGAQHSDRTLISGAAAMIDSSGIIETDVQLLAFPFAHVGGMLNTAVLLHTGGRMLMIERFEPETHIPMVGEKAVTLLGSGPAFHQMYVDAQRAMPEKRLFPHARMAYGGGAACSPQLAADIESVLGLPVVLSYGMSECAMVAGHDPADSREMRTRSVGRPVPTADVVIVTADGSRAAVGEEGSVHVRAPHLFLGYLDEDLNEEAFDDEGYFVTGDRGYIDEQGYLFLTGRDKDIIIRKGENISAQEVERIIATHPSVAGVALIGLPDVVRGEMACAVMVAQPGAERLTMKELQDWLAKSGLARYKWPERIEYVNELPLISLGKVAKRELKAALAEADEATAR